MLGINGWVQNFHPVEQTTVDQRKALFATSALGRRGIWMNDLQKRTFCRLIRLPHGNRKRDHRVMESGCANQTRLDSLQNPDSSVQYSVPLFEMGRGCTTSCTTGERQVMPPDGALLADQLPLCGHRPRFVGRSHLPLQ
jgi:hypothetical protein